MATTRTSRFGRFEFRDLVAGRYSIRVVPIGRNLAESNREVLLKEINGRTPDADLEIYLSPNRGKGENLNQDATGLLFVEDVPEKAKQLYKEALKDLAANRTQGAEKLEAAISLAPQYYSALYMLGRLSYSRGEYEKAVAYLTRAVSSNSRSYVAVYALALGYYKIRDYEKGLETSRLAAALAPQSVDALLLHGTLLRLNSKLDEAVKTLAKANELADGRNIELHWQLALAYNRMNRNEDARNELETFLKLAPNSPDRPKIEELMEKLKRSRQGN